MAGRPKRKQDLLRLQQESDLGEMIMDRLTHGEQLTRICYDTELCKAAILEWIVGVRCMPSGAAVHPSALGKAARRVEHKET